MIRGLAKTYIRQPRNELVSVGLFAGLLDEFPLPLFWGILPLGPDQSVGNVLKDRVVEQKWFLLDEADLGSPPLEIKLMEILASYLDGTISEKGNL